MAIYEIGDRVEITTSTPFQDADGVAFDPDTVTFEIKEPGTATVSYVNGTDPEVTQNGTGDYSCTIDVDTAGVWYYYILGEQSGGENRGADRGRFTVLEKGT